MSKSRFADFVIYFSVPVAFVFANVNKGIDLWSHREGRVVTI